VLVYVYHCTVNAVHLDLFALALKDLLQMGTSPLSQADEPETSWIQEKYETRASDTILYDSENSLAYPELFTHALHPLYHAKNEQNSST
jgi:hypothetical protein